MCFQTLVCMILTIAAVNCEDARGHKKRGIFGEQLGLGAVGSYATPGVTQAIFLGNNGASSYLSSQALSSASLAGLSSAVSGIVSPAVSTGGFIPSGIYPGVISSAPILGNSYAQALPNFLLPSGGASLGVIPAGDIFPGASSLPTIGVGAGVELGRHITVTNRFAVPVPQAVPVPVQNDVAVPVPSPVAVPVDRPVAVPVAQPYAVPVVKPVGVPVEKSVPVPVPQPVPVTVYQPVPVPVASPVAVPVVQDVPVPFVRQVPVVVSDPYSEIRNFW